MLEVELAVWRIEEQRLLEVLKLPWCRRSAPPCRRAGRAVRQ